MEYVNHMVVGIVSKILKYIYDTKLGTNEDSGVNVIKIQKDFPVR